MAWDEFSASSEAGQLLSCCSSPFDMHSSFVLLIVSAKPLDALKCLVAYIPVLHCEPLTLTAMQDRPRKHKDDG